MNNKVYVKIKLIMFTVRTWFLSYYKHFYFVKLLRNKLVWLLAISVAEILAKKSEIIDS